MKRRAGLWAAGAVAALTLLGGCASPPAAPDSGPHWSGRLALTVQSDPPQSFSAGFELHGQPRQGQLRLSTPLGNTLATVVWSPGLAELHTSGPAQRFDSLDTLTLQLTGSSLPIATWFDWLSGIATPANGWQADLSRLPQGRLTAQRLPPEVAAELRVVLDQ